MYTADPTSSTSNAGACTRFQDTLDVEIFVACVQQPVAKVDTGC